MTTTWNPALPRSAFACASLSPITLGTLILPEDDHEAPRRSRSRRASPPGGRCDRTVSAGRSDALVSSVPRTRPAAVSALVASERVRPTSVGTATWAGPPEMVTSTELLGSTSALAAGSCVMIVPSGASLSTGVTVPSSRPFWASVGGRDGLRLAGQVRDPDLGAATAEDLGGEEEDQAEHGDDAEGQQDVPAARASGAASRGPAAIGAISWVLSTAAAAATAGHDASRFVTASASRSRSARISAAVW